MRFLQGLCAMILGAVIMCAVFIYHPIRETVCGWLDDWTHQTVEQTQDETQPNVPDST